MPLFAPYSPDARGVVDDRIVVQQAEPHDVAGIVAVAQARGPQVEGYADRVAGITFEGGEGVLLCATRLEEDA